MYIMKSSKLPQLLHHDHMFDLQIPQAVYHGILCYTWLILVCMYVFYTQRLYNTV